MWAPTFSLPKWWNCKFRSSQWRWEFMLRLNLYCQNGRFLKRQVSTIYDLWIRTLLFWANYNDVSRLHPKWWFNKGTSPKFPQFRFRNYTNLPSIIGVSTSKWHTFHTFHGQSFFYKGAIWARHQSSGTGRKGFKATATLNPSICVIGVWSWIIAIIIIIIIIIIMITIFFFFFFFFFFFCVFIIIRRITITITVSSSWFLFFSSNIRLTIIITDNTLSTLSPLSLSILLQYGDVQWLL